MPRKSKPAESELIPADSRPTWTVITTHDGDQPVHRLLYGTTVQDRGKTPGCLERLRAVAAWCNKRNLAPRVKVQCLADLPTHPVKALKASERTMRETEPSAP